VSEDDQMAFDWDLSGVKHSIPPDDFLHIESMDCGCSPYVQAVVGIGGAICHRRIVATEAPDALPEGWE
jgi:hypothetical protein